MRKLSNKKVMVFGVFDGLHPGHLFFFKKASRYGALFVVVARDSAVQKLKGKKPRVGEKRRLQKIKEATFVKEAAFGDRIQSTYKIIKKIKPDVICVGYDQQWLEKDLKRRMRMHQIPRIKLLRIRSYRPRKFHSSLLRKRSIDSQLIKNS